MLRLLSRCCWTIGSKPGSSARSATCTWPACCTPARTLCCIRAVGGRGPAAGRAADQALAAPRRGRPAAVDRSGRPLAAAQGHRADESHSHPSSARREVAGGLGRLEQRRPAQGIPPGRRCVGPLAARTPPTAAGCSWSGSSSRSSRQISHCSAGSPTWTHAALGRTVAAPGSEVASGCSRVVEMLLRWDHTWSKSVSSCGYDSRFAYQLPWRFAMLRNCLLLSACRSSTCRDGHRRDRRCCRPRPQHPHRRGAVRRLEALFDGKSTAGWRNYKKDRRSARLEGRGRGAGACRPAARATSSPRTSSPPSSCPWTTRFPRKATAASCSTSPRKGASLAHRPGNPDSGQQGRPRPAAFRLAVSALQARDRRHQAGRRVEPAPRADHAREVLGHR